MKKVYYYNNYGVECVRHGTITKNSIHYVFTPSDTTKKIIIPFDKFIKSSKCRVKTKEMNYINNEYIPKPDDPT